MAVDRTRRNKKRSRRGCSRKQVGGNVGAGYSIGGPILPGLPTVNNYAASVNSIGNCHAVTPSYAITPPPATGLPGMGMRGGRRRRGRKQSGGRYGFDLGSMPAPAGAALAQGGYPEVVKIGCQANLQNPLNPTHTAPNSTPGAVSSAGLGESIARAFGQTGGYSPLGQAAVSEAYVAPTAGYDNKPSTWLDSVGAPVQLQIPYAARMMNPACLKTGGSRRRMRRHRRKGRKTRGRRQRGGDKTPMEVYNEKVKEIENKTGKTRESAEYTFFDNLRMGITVIDGISFKKEGQNKNFTLYGKKESDGDDKYVVITTQHD